MRLTIAILIIGLAIVLGGVVLVSSEDNPHGRLSRDCADCHSTASWHEMAKPMKFSHKETGFRLDGAHATVSCASCHSELVFSHVGTACADCHADHHQGQLGLDCQNCHVTRDWHPQVDLLQQHADRGFPLTGVHAVADCESCHQSSDRNEFAGTPTDCASCHRDDLAQATDPDHSALSFGTDCERCHRAGFGSWNRTTYQHPGSFPLTGAHATTNCGSCHAETFAGTPTDCYSCHSGDFQTASDPDHVNGNFPQDCSQCHTTVAWEPATFDHELTAFPLRGQHVGVNCQSCHATQYTGTPTDCYSCHRTDFESTSDPDHVGSQFPTDCQTCHTVNGWSPATVDHDKTAFPLTGKHVGVDCQTCHANSYTGTPTDCYSCHESEYRGAGDPDHVGSQFPTTCEQCHNTSGWAGAQINHDLTSFPLTGAHVQTDCAFCHATSFTGTPTDCYTCHQTNFASAVDPNHVGSNFPTGCQTCHTTTAWSPSQIDHSLTLFPLTGAHVQVDCASCHVTSYTGTPSDCYSCHQTNYDGTTNPNHAASQIATTCQDCHTTTTWQPADFDHNQTAFPLTGQHAIATCISCHAGGYSNTSSNCYSCHQTDFAGAVNPDHSANQFPTTCQDCHSTNAWIPSTFDHNQTAFPLTGMHTSQTCIACHATQYTGTPTNCYSCHQTDYTGTTDPNHVSANFATTCQDCHTTNAWQPSSFDHNTTSFPLTGQHSNGTCISCHATQYAGTPTDCYSCHQADYAGTTNPDHAAMGFPTTCQDCHTTTAWLPADFDHNQTALPLSGQHTTLQCAACHATQYSGTPTDCYACHQSDYNGTTNPNHTSANFPTACVSCHTTNGWVPSTWDHDTQYFPIYSGAHAGSWSDCNQCHTIPSNFSTFDCTACHAHNATDMNAKHSQVNNYQYASAACYTCHPDGLH